MSWDLLRLSVYVQSKSQLLNTFPLHRNHLSSFFHLTTTTPLFGSL